MSAPVIKNVQTQAVGFGPILRHYFDQCGIQRIIDDHVELAKKENPHPWSSCCGYDYWHAVSGHATVSNLKICREKNSA